MKFRWNFPRKCILNISLQIWYLSGLLSGSNTYLSDQSVFYNTVLSHGDGSIKNYPIRKDIPDAELCKSQGLSNVNFLELLHTKLIDYPRMPPSRNDDPVAICICRYIDLFTILHIFSLGLGFVFRRDIWLSLEPFDYTPIQNLNSSTIKNHDHLRKSTRKIWLTLEIDFKVEFALASH